MSMSTRSVPTRPGSCVSTRARFCPTSPSSPLRSSFRTAIARLRSLGLSGKDLAEDLRVGVGDSAAPFVAVATWLVCGPLRSPGHDLSERSLLLERTDTSPQGVLHVVVLDLEKRLG